MLDNQGYRIGVGIVLLNAHNQVFLGKRQGLDAWQFPQGGVLNHETPQQAMYRELEEETGLPADSVKIVHSSKSWLKYQFPEYLMRKFNNNKCIGQKQKWFLLSLINDDAKINLLATNNPEFESWSWVEWSEPLRRIVEFKYKVYEKFMNEFHAFINTTN